MDSAKDHVSLGFTGISSFARWPVHTDLDSTKADVAVLGIPYDQSTQWRTGCRFGPRAIRDSSMQYAMGPSGYFDPERKTTYLGNRWQYVDSGDVEMVHGNQERCHDNIRLAVTRLLKSGVSLPFFLGGDHSVTAPILEAFQDSGPLHVIQFDAHLDFVDERNGNRYGNGSPLRRASDCQHVTGITHLGIRGPASSGKTEFEETTGQGNPVLSVRDIRDLGVQAVLDHIPSGENFYITIDFDVLDPSVAPGLASPSPGGMTYYEVQEILEGITSRGKVIGFDLVEVCPPYDVSDLTSQLAARLSLDLVGFVLESR